MFRSRFFMIAFIFCICICAVFAGGTGEQPPSASEPAAESAPVVPLKILYPKAVASVPLLAVLEAYPDEYEGEFFTDHPQAMAQLLNGEVDLLTTGFSVGLNRFTAAGDVVHLLTPVWGVSALMTAEPIQSLADLAGGVIYSPFEGSPIDIYLKEAFALDGLSDSIEIAYAPFPQSAGLLAQKKIAASVLVEPLASKLEIQGAAYRFENLHDGWARVSGGEPRSPQVSLFATRATVDADEGALALFASRYAEAVREVAADPEGSAEKFSENLGFPAPIVRKALENTLFEVPSAEVTREIIDSYAGVMGLDPPSAEFYADLK